MNLALFKRNIRRLNDINFALCGLDCTKCSSFQNNEYKGCHEMKGTSINGKCEWYHGCKDNKLEHLIVR